MCTMNTNSFSVKVIDNIYCHDLFVQVKNDNTDFYF